jgi:hypothetical protein
MSDDNVPDDSVEDDDSISLFVWQRFLLPLVDLLVAAAVALPATQPYTPG